MSTPDNYYQITQLTEQALVGVWAFPEGVQIEVHGHTADLSFEQVENLSHILLLAVEQAKKLEWIPAEDEDAEPNELRLRQRDE